MDCCICSAMPYMLRPPRHTLCAACFEGARSIITLTNKADGDKSTCKSSSASNASSASLPNSSKGFANALKWLKEMKEMEDELTQKLSFLTGFSFAFKEQIHTDILIKPGDNGPSIPAHRALLAARSEIFRTLLESDGFKAPPDGVVSLPELNHQELESLLEFLYSGDLGREKLERHMCSLSLAADKYEIHYLRRFCEQHMLEMLSSANALEIADASSNQSLKETALGFIVKNMEGVVFSARFDAFALRNPHLTVQITRASFMDIKSRSSGT